MSAHTPGPWRYEAQGEISTYHGIYGADDEYVADAWDGSVGNARLIAAAPELLDALAELVACKGERSPKSAARLINAWAGARDAIAKATGQ